MKKPKQFLLICRRILTIFLFLGWMTICFTYGFMGMNGYKRYQLKRSTKNIVKALHLFSDADITAAAKIFKKMSYSHFPFENFFDGYAALFEQDFSLAKSHFDIVLEHCLSNKYVAAPHTDLCFSEAIAGRFLTAFFEQDKITICKLNKTISDNDILLVEKDFFSDLSCYINNQKTSDLLFKKSFSNHSSITNNWSTFAVKSLFPNPFLTLLQTHFLLVNNKIKEALDLCDTNKELLSTSSRAYQNKFFLLQVLLYLKQAQHSPIKRKKILFEAAAKYCKKVSNIPSLSPLPSISFDDVINTISLSLTDIIRSSPSLGLDFLNIVEKKGKKDDLHTISLKMINTIGPLYSSKTFLHTLIENNSQSTSLNLCNALSQVYLDKVVDHIKNHSVTYASNALKSALSFQPDLPVHNFIQLSPESFSCLVRFDSCKLPQVHAYLSLWDHVSDDCIEKIQLKELVLNEACHALMTKDWSKGLNLSKLSFHLFNHNEEITSKIKDVLQKLVEKASKNLFVYDVLEIQKIANSLDVNLVLQFSQAQIINLWADAQFFFSKGFYDKAEKYCQWIQQISPNFREINTLLELVSAKKYEQKKEPSPINHFASSISYSPSLYSSSFCLYNPISINY